jgi:small subunit ribosomal protein S8
LAKVLASEGWIRSVNTKEDGKFKQFGVGTQIHWQRIAMISGINRVSKPGQRIYSKTSEIPRSLGGVGTTIVSTSKGLMTDKHARQEQSWRRSYLPDLVIKIMSAELVKNLL